MRFSFYVCAYGRAPAGHTRFWIKQKRSVITFKIST